MLRDIGLASIVGALVSIGPARSDAMVAVAASVEDLTKASSLVVVVTPVEQRSVWEGGRIMTDSRVHIEERVADEGDAHREAQDVWVRTLGGVADGIGQVVEGEAQLTMSHPSLLFLHRSAPAGADSSREMFRVVAHAQGQYDVLGNGTSKPALRTLSARRAGLLLKRPWAPPLVGPSPAATEVLHGKTLDDAETTIRTAWRQTHAK